MLGQPHNEVLLPMDRQLKRHKPFEDRIILKDGILIRNHYGESAGIKIYQNLYPKQLLDDVLRSLQRKFGKHPRVAKTTFASREKQYKPNMAQLIKKSATSCKQCIRESKTQLKLIHLSI